MSERLSVCIIGPGRMGIGIATALCCSPSSYKLRIVDVKVRQTAEGKQALGSAKKQIQNNLTLLRELGEVEKGTSNTFPNITFCSGYENIEKDTSIVFEALPEEPALKQEFIKRIEPLVNEETIIASATSTIDLGTICKLSSSPERIVIAHWLNPAFIIPLVEVAKGKETAAWVIEKIRQFLVDVGKIPVVLKDSPGFIVPRIQVAAMNEAVRILEEGVATPEEIDTAIKAGFGFRLAVLGLIEFIDLGGLDILYHASQYLFEKLDQEQYKPLRSVVRKMEKGEIGPRSGRGYFDYSGINAASIFRKRYTGFLELLNLVRNSKSLSFRGGISLPS